MIKLYVAPNGNDGAEGCSSSPLRTFSGVRAKIEKIKAEKDEAIEVLFAGGYYDMTSENVNFSKELSGSAKAPITFAAADENDRPLFNGGIKLDLSKAKKVTDKAILDSVIDSSARNGLYVIDVKELVHLLPDGHQLYDYNTSSFFRNGKSMFLARYPKKKHPDSQIEEGSWLYTDRVIHHSDSPATSPFTVFSDYSTFYRIQKHWSEKTLKDVYFKGYLWHNWSHCCYKADSFDFEKCSFTSNEGTHAYQFSLEDRKYRRFYFYNVMEEIADHNEYYIDKEKGLMYFYPESLDDEIIFTFSANSALTLENVEHINFRGLEFSYFITAPVKVEKCRNICFDKCVFSHCNGNGGLVVMFTTDMTIKNCLFADLGASGLFLEGKENHKDLVSDNILIEGNEFYNCSRIKKCYAPGINTWGTIGTVIRNNKFHGSAQMLLFLDAMDALVEYNEFYDAVRDTDDASCVYWGRVAHTIGNTFRYNYFHDLGNTVFSTQGIGAIYTDDNATSAEIYGNVFHNAALFGDIDGKQLYDTMNATLFLNAATFCNTHDNIFLMGTPGETPMSDVGHYAFLWWARNTMGAYIPGSAATISQQQHWKEDLQRLGLLDGNNADKKWKEHYKGTVWESMFKLFTDDNYYRGAKDENGNVYGIPDIQKMYADGRIDAEKARQMFDEYTEKVVDGIYGSDYVPNAFRKNIVIGMHPRFWVESEKDSMRRTPHSENLYITFDQAKEFFADYKSGDYRLTEKGAKAVADAMGNIDCPKTK